MKKMSARTIVQPFKQLYIEKINEASRESDSPLPSLKKLN